MDTSHASCAHARDLTVDEARLTGLLARAREIAETSGEKWTASRARVYELLVRAGGPVKAYDIMPLYAADRTAKPPTVYRALEFLQNLGLAHHIPSLSAFMACRGGDPTHAASFLICQCCGSADEIAPDLSNIISRASLRTGFEASLATLEIRGLCSRCQTA